MRQPEGSSSTPNDRTPPTRLPIASQRRAEFAATRQRPRDTIFPIGRRSMVADAATETLGDNAAISRERLDPSQRIFVGRSLRLETIRFFGFDMDYTLANYKSPAYEELVFERTINRLIDSGYPKSIRTLHYNRNFPIRGLWFDQLYGNLLKVDGFGNILLGIHGFRFLSLAEIEEFLELNDQRVIVLNTLFNLPDTYLLAALVDFFDRHLPFKILEDFTGVSAGDIVMTYRSIARDIQSAVQWVHTEGSMKNFVLSNLPDYIQKDERIRQLLPLLRQHGAQTFLLTNSGYKYTNKPQWFAEGTVFRQVDSATGSVRLGTHTGPLRRGEIYAGGSCEAFRRLVHAPGKDVLYIGDHIFGDVLRSKKSNGWRTFLVVPELEQQINVWTEKSSLFERLEHLDIRLAQLYQSAHSSSQHQIDETVKAIRNATHEMDHSYGILGSLFRSGSRTTFFASQLERYADLYSASPFNLIYYPMFYFFRSPMRLLPHESTVDHLTRLGQKQAQNGSHKFSTGIAR